jgi:hypothetical protein
MRRTDVHFSKHRKVILIEDIIGTLINLDPEILSSCQFLLTQLYDVPIHLFKHMQTLPVNKHRYIP